MKLSYTMYKAVSSRMSLFETMARCLWAHHRRRIGAPPATSKSGACVAQVAAVSRRAHDRRERHARLAPAGQPGATDPAPRGSNLKIHGITARRSRWAPPSNGWTAPRRPSRILEIDISPFGDRASATSSWHAARPTDEGAEDRQEIGISRLGDLVTHRRGRRGAPGRTLT